MIPLSLYIHFPWCIQKCPYCDFNSHKQGGRELYQHYMASLIDDVIEILPLIWGRPVRSIFIGGGTPSLIVPEDLDALFSKLRAYLTIEPNAEITLEANPGTVDRNFFKEYYEIGINRLSIGMQSLNSKHLQKLGRIHSPEDALYAFSVAKDAGFNNINCDLMFGLPGQTLNEMQQDLATVIDMAPTHISHYQLTLEPNTYFYKFPPKLPESELIEEMQLSAYQQLDENGFLHYEVSAFARKSYECFHNKNYWLFGDYIGIGSGAHGKITLMDKRQVVRTTLEKHPKNYVNQSACERLVIEEVARNDLPFEFMLNALRLRAPIPLSLFSERTYIPLNEIMPILSELEAKGLMKLGGDYLETTDSGFLFLNQVLEFFLQA